MSDVTRILDQVAHGDAVAAEQLLPLVYEDLRQLAASRMASERRDHTLQATALVHESYLRLVSQSQPVDWQGRGHFFAAAAEAMRRILVEKARSKQRVKHGGDRQRVPLEDAVDHSDNQDLLALDAALEELAKEDPLAVRVVELRRFAGLNHHQIAETLQITVYAARQKWTYARAWLRNVLRTLE
ncbi:MAG TPA: RNA polymerase subunit sigma [Planctomycetaceae bacterium]|nr:RNA polymerase subunit sigma [Blastopirellula sp.]HAY78883.1 RNA polymerase subunit sigma [Planctomycetaceae bacterium]